jgi:hypothetical protein
MKDWVSNFFERDTLEVNARVVGKLEFVNNVSKKNFNWIWPIESACKLLIGSFEYRLLAVGM